jgi:hypothetical protein
MSERKRVFFKGTDHKGVTMYAYQSGPAESVNPETAGKMFGMKNVAEITEDEWKAAHGTTPEAVPEQEPPFQPADAAMEEPEKPEEAPEPMPAPEQEPETVKTEEAPKPKAAPKPKQSRKAKK